MSDERYNHYNNESYRNNSSNGIYNNGYHSDNFQNHKPPKKRRGGGPLILLIILLTLLVIAGGIMIFAGVYMGRTDTQTTLEQETELIQEEPLVLQEETRSQEISDTEVMRAMVLDVSGVVKEAMPSIVAITSKTVQEVRYFFSRSMEIESESSGSGFIIAENDEELLIATNYHVIEGASSLSVCFSAEDVEEELLVVEAVEKGSEPQRDLAVVAVKLTDIPEEVKAKIEAAPLGISEDVLVGEPAIAIGNALGYGQSVTLGIISAKNRVLEIEGNENTYLQTDAAINFGNSGGALFNVEGQVIGINSAKATASDAEGMGYAIPIDDARPILEELMNRKTREKVPEEEQGYLGISVQDISSEARSLYSIPSGVYIDTVESGSPAEKAGLKHGDILSKIDDISVTSTDRMEELLVYFRAGETVSLEILVADQDGYAEKNVELTFGEKPAQTQEYSRPGYGWGWQRFGY